MDVFDVLSVLRITPFPAFYSISGLGCWANLARFHGDSQKRSFRLSGVTLFRDLTYVPDGFFGGV